MWWMATLKGRHYMCDKSRPQATLKGRNYIGLRKARIDDTLSKFVV